MSVPDPGPWRPNVKEVLSAIMKLRRGEKDATTAGLDTKLDANLDAAALSRIEWVSRILADRRKDRR